MRNNGIDASNFYTGMGRSRVALPHGFSKNTLRTEPGLSASMKFVGGNEATLKPVDEAAGEAGVKYL
ncbi:MAG: hypothetical protein ACLGJB_16750 [Blastocatellia bacterium]